MFITSLSGAVYSLDANTGCTRIGGSRAATGVRSGMAVGDANSKPAVFFSDQGSTLYALNAQTGELLWKIRPAVHFTAMPTATPVFYKGVVYQAYSSFEEAIAADPSYACCSARGSVVALDPATGKTIWQTFTVPEPKPTRKNAAGTQQNGPSGAGVWSTPTIDEQLGVLYVATGDNYSDPATETSDAILAIDLKTGKVLWSKQLTEKDAYTNGCNTPQLTNCPEAHGPDFDFRPIADPGPAQRRKASAGDWPEIGAWCTPTIPTPKERSSGRPALAQVAPSGAANGARRRTDRRSTSPSPISESAAYRTPPCRRAFA